MANFPSPDQALSNSNMSLELGRLARDHFGMQTFVETGTLHGWNARRAADMFQRVYSIDLVYKYTAKAQQEYGRPNLIFLCGSSPDVLKDHVLPEIQGPAIFWLDAHCSDPAHLPDGQHECPLLEEIKVVTRHNPRHIILIDDMRLITAPPPKPHRWEHWPDLVQVITALEGFDPAFRIAIMHDIMLRMPADCWPVFRDFWHNRSG